ncbi:MAG: TIM barrel protein [Candidatus Omnitrophota bacterium]|nr:TIM barrel protein [Candidatus Omnitrophota bacterium]
MHQKDIILSAKCAPEEKILADIKKAGIEAVELYLSRDILTDLKRILELCKKFSFRYVLHAPNGGYELFKLVTLAKALSAEVVVFHNIYWDDEYKEIAKSFRHLKAKICVENISTVHEPIKFMRRYNFGMCLDLEHLQMECAGVYEEEFIRAIKNASHIHLTGYKFGSRLWHTHLHHSPKHNLCMLNLIKKAGYAGFIVSEAKTSLQTYAEFKKLSNFFKRAINS